MAGTSGLCRFPDPTSPYPTSIPCAVWERLPLPWNPYFLSLLSPVTCASEPRLSLVTEGMGETSHYHLTIPAKRVGHGATPSFSAIRFLNKKLECPPLRLCWEGNQEGETQGEEHILILGSCLLYGSQSVSVCLGHTGGHQDS